MKQSSECSQESEIRGALGAALLGSNVDLINNLTGQLADHRRLCPVCNGTALKQFFAKVPGVVCVREFTPIAVNIKGVVK